MDYYRWVDLVGRVYGLPDSIGFEDRVRALRVRGAIVAEERRRVESSEIANMIDMVKKGAL